MAMVVLDVGGELLAGIMPDTRLQLGTRTDAVIPSGTQCTEAKPEDGRCMTSSRWHMYAFACQGCACVLRSGR
jgi:hypothetical protein